jgi:hypothetical protein
MSEIRKYRKKPVVIEAVRFEKPYWVVQEFCPSLQLVKDWQMGTKVAYAFITTLEGIMRADIGWWIIKGVQGEFYPCRDDIFRMTYEAVTGEG